jgi:uncharacterized protein (DUF2345 family)
VRFFLRRACCGRDEILRFAQNDSMGVRAQNDSMGVRAQNDIR